MKEYFNQGADRYIQKPFGLDSVRLYIRNLLERALVGKADEFIKNSALDPEIVWQLTRLDRRLLNTLVVHDGGWVPNETLLTQTWGPNSISTDQDLLNRIFIIRHKLGPAIPIENQPGLGYRLVTEAIKKHIPLKKPTSEAKNSDGAKNSDIPHRALLVGNDRRFVDHLENMEEYGIAVSVLRSIDRTVEELTNPKGADMVLLDRDRYEDKKDVLQDIVKLRGACANIPVIVVSGMSNYHELTDILNGGADHYLSKYYSPAKIAAHIHSILRRGDLVNTQPNWVAVGEVEVDLSSAKVRKNGHPIALTPHEQALLGVLIQFHDRLMYNNEILIRAFGIEHQGDDAFLRPHLAHLSSRLGKGSILNFKGLGYKLAV